MFSICFNIRMSIVVKESIIFAVLAIITHQIKSMPHEYVSSFHL